MAGDWLRMMMEDADINRRVLSEPTFGNKPRHSDGKVDCRVLRKAGVTIGVPTAKKEQRVGTCRQIAKLAGRG